ncbi:putative nucleotidyltransferase/HEPN domain-containing protein [Ensifer sp. KUDG1]|uniref:nucleotidyltransferase and HEPN domain-containing protein n=1 Tax=Ensifer sp. KUDG1 TaxID=3373919 RepID=UPI003D21E5CA
MKTSLDHLPAIKQKELRRVVEIIHEEFDDALKGGSAEFKKRGRILKIVLFGSYSRGTFVDEPHTKKGYRSDFDILVIVNNKKLTDPTDWNRTNDRLMRDREIQTPVSVIVHALREVNTNLREGRYFFVDIARDGIALYDLDNEPLATPGCVGAQEAWRLASEYLADRLPRSRVFLRTSRFCAGEGNHKEAAFLLHQSIEQAYSTLLLVLTNYSPSSHNLRFLRGLAEDRAEDLVEVWPEQPQRYAAWFNVLNEAYVKARYSPHYDISSEALDWLAQRTEILISKVEAACLGHLERTRPPSK